MNEFTLRDVRFPGYVNAAAPVPATKYGIEHLPE